MLVAHLAALVVLVTTGRLPPLLILNVLMAAIALFGLSTRLRYMLIGPDLQMLALAAFELLTLALAAAAGRGWRFTAAASIAVFGLHLLAAAAALALALLFRWDRLF